MRLLPILAMTLAAAACGPQKSPQANAPETEAEAGPVKGVDRSHRGKPAPDAAFNDPDGHEIRLAEFRGVPVLVNLWASWCAPCVKELPTLDRLSQSHAVDGALGVLAVSQDSGPHASVEAFLKEHGIRDLGAYQDPKMSLSGALGAEVLPMSVLYDTQGHEVWRYVGDLDWTGGEAAKLLAEASAARPR